MEVTQDQIIGVMLNVLGYLTAGALWTVIYSFFRGRRGAERPAVRTVPATDEEPAPAAQVSARPKSRIEFVNFKGADTGRSRTDRTVAPAEGTRPEANRRNRSEIIRLAREMLLDNTPDEKIKQTLPITDGELAMINNGVKHG